ncbi:MAG: lamin tail domain-containing protein [Candidatus Peribacteraceae bacterium]
MHLFRLLTFLSFSLLPVTLHAQVAFSELLWMGSDQSTADEWIELHNFSETEIDLTGWQIRYINSSGVDTLMVSLQGTIEAGDVFLISNFDEPDSRLAILPNIVTTSVSLPNANLLVRLLDEQGTLVDEADDGSDTPLAGTNTPSLKASMERVDFLASGRAQSSWTTASRSINLDPESPVLATPGEVFQSGGSSSSSSSCSDPLVATIDVQSGDTTGVGSTTINVQAVATVGSITGLACAFDFGDGFLSSSCNPGPHAYDEPGSFLLTLRVHNRCGEELVDTLPITVTSVGSTSSSSPSFTYDGASIILSSILPNPDGADTDAEMLVFHNLVDRSTVLTGWKLQVETTKTRTYTLAGSLGALGALQLFSSESTFSLPNSEAEIRLIDPLGGVRSTFRYEKAEEGRRYFPEDILDIDVSGTVQAVLSGTQFVIEANPRVREKTGLDQIPAELLGVLEIQTDSDLSASFSLSSSMWLRALVEKKRVTLELPEKDIWSGDQFLRARVYADGNFALVEDGLLKGYLRTDGTEHPFREHYEQLEADAKKNKRGLWAYASASTSSSSSVTTSQTLSRTVDPHAYQGLVFSEVFASPYPRSAQDEHTDQQLFYEWIEIANEGDSAFDLAGWTVEVGSRRSVLSGSFIIPPHGFFVLSDELMPPLANGGAEISLVSPDASLVFKLGYPALKHGFSYAFFEDEYCVTAKPTQGVENECEVPTPVDRSASAKKAAVTRKENTLAGYASLVYADQAHAESFQLESRSAPETFSLLGLLLASTFGLAGGLAGGLTVRRK